MSKRPFSGIAASSLPFPIPQRIRTPISLLPVEEHRLWLEEVKMWLEGKMQREQAYLNRRKARGVRTPTDDCYEIDQVYEQALYALLRQELGE